MNEFANLGRVLPLPLAKLPPTSLLRSLVTECACGDSPGAADQSSSDCGLQRLVDTAAHP